MEWTDLVALVLLVAILIGNIVATVAVARSRVFERAQKHAQLYLIWLLPVIGAGTVLHFTLGSKERNESEFSDRAGGSGVSYDLNSQ